MIMYILVRLVDFYSLVIVVYVLMSWLPTDRGILHDIYTVLGKICDPYLNLFRQLIPPIGGFLDISPIFALLVLQLAVCLLVSFVGFIV
ncbi:MAG: YggT family protein [Coriobacteriia bacterium]|nr:YggT family protein [Coriobacteriia bacterium]